MAKEKPDLVYGTLDMLILKALQHDPLGLSYPEFLDYEKNSTLFESFIVDRIMGTVLRAAGRRYN